MLSKTGEMNAGHAGMKGGCPVHETRKGVRTGAELYVEGIGYLRCTTLNPSSIPMRNWCSQAQLRSTLPFSSYAMGCGMYGAPAKLNAHPYVTRKD